MEECPDGRADVSLPSEDDSKEQEEQKKGAPEEESPMKCNPSMSEGLEEDLEKIKGDMIGTQLFSLLIKKLFTYKTLFCFQEKRSTAKDGC
jgi:hypothetical protein